MMADEHISRRHLLAAVGGVSSLAGCASVLNRGDTESTEEPTPESTTEAEPDSTTETDPGSTTKTDPEFTTFEIAPTEPEAGAEIRVSVAVSNDDDVSQTGTIRVSVGQNATERQISIPADGTASQTLTTEQWQTGTHEVAAELFRDGDQVAASRTTINVVPVHDAFVEVSGTDFVIDGAPVYYSGGHAGGNLHSRTASDDEDGWEYDYDDAFDGNHYVADFMQYAAANDMSVIRTTVSGVPWAEDSRVHEAPGEFNDDWFELFDTVIAEAKRNGIRLVVSTLAHDLDLAPSPGAYAKWSDTVDDDLDRDALYDAFFADEQAKQYHRNFVEKLLTRENHITGIEYRNDPTIMLWECGNEIEYRRYDERGNSLADWYDETARHIKSLDDNHLVGSGMYGSDTRNEFVTDHQSDAIDVCSIHLYPKYPNRQDIAEKPYEEEPAHDMSIEEMVEYIEEKVEIAHNKIGKPIILGEFNVMQFPDIYGWDLEMRREYLEAMYDVADRVNLNGVHAFALTLDKKCTGEVRITDCRAESGIYPGDESLSIIGEYSSTVAAKSSGDITE